MQVSLVALVCSALALAGGWVGWRLGRSYTSLHSVGATITASEVMEMDFNGDGVNDVLYYYSNDVAQKLLMDRNLDGKMDYLEFYTNGIPLRAQCDDHFDGKPDLFIDYKWGQPSVARQDTDTNGVPDVTYFFSNGVLARAIYEPNGTGAVVRESKYLAGRVCEDTFYDANSNIQFRLYYDCYGRRIQTPTQLSTPATHD